MKKNNRKLDERIYLKKDTIKIKEIEYYFFNKKLNYIGENVTIGHIIKNKKHNEYEFYTDDRIQLNIKILQKVITLLENKNFA